MTFNGESERSQFLLDEEGFSDSDTESQSQVGLTPPPDQSAKAKLKALLFGGVADTAPPATVSSTATPEYKLYPWRWLMLVSMFLLNISNGTMWLTFAPIPQYTAVYYSISLSQVDWFSIAYFVVSLLTGFLAIAILDVFGLKVSLYLGAVFNLVGSCLRWFSCAEFILCSRSTAGFALAMTGQVLTACAQPFLLYAPTKLANVWFGPNERAFCTMLASLGNPMGLAMAQLTSPYIVTSLNKFHVLHAVYTGVAAVGGVITLLSFWWSEPPQAPAASAVKSKIPFLSGLKKTLTSPAFLCLMVVWGCGSGLFNALLTLLAQILCPYGYSDEKSGLWGALMVFIGLVGATIGGVVIDFTKLYKEVTVVVFSLALLFYIAFTMLFDLVHQDVAIAFSIALFGFFGLPLIPACMELGVEITYPVSEATSSGLLWSTTQVVGIVLVLLGQFLQQDVPVVRGSQDSQCELQELDSSDTVCSTTNSSLVLESVPPQDFTRALLVYAGVGVAGYLVLVLLFRPTYKRLAVERRAKRIMDHLKKPASRRAPSHSPSSSPQHSPPETNQPSSPPHAAPMSHIHPSYHTSTEL